MHRINEIQHHMSQLCIDKTSTCQVRECMQAVGNWEVTIASGFSGVVGFSKSELNSQEPPVCSGKRRIKSRIGIMQLICIFIINQQQLRKLLKCKAVLSSPLNIYYIIHHNQRTFEKLNENCIYVYIYYFVLHWKYTNINANPARVDGERERERERRGEERGGRE